MLSECFFAWGLKLSSYVARYVSEFSPDRLIQGDILSSSFQNLINTINFVLQL